MPRDHVLGHFGESSRMQIDYAKELNEQQFQAVTAPPGPSLVIAGAGSGKTRTLTYRVAYLLEQGIPPERILLLTFTNKAAKEMMRRVAELIGQPLDSLWGGTFHSIGNRLLRRHGAALGYARDFTIMDREDTRHLISACLGEANIDVKATRFPKADVLGEMFSLSVNTQKPLATVVSAQFRHFSHMSREIDDLRERYEARKRAMNTMDFDDLLVLWLRLLKENEPVREDLQQRFQFILVDEYQDTNLLQSDVIDLLAARHRNLMVVGDDAQSIYAWRGANYRNILKFQDRYPEAKVYRVETNYRSTPEILMAANAAIARNTQQFVKELVPARRSGIKPVIAACGNATIQARFVARRVLALREEGTNLDRIAVLYRSHFHALELQLELTHSNIPFTITSGIRFFEQAHIKDVTAYLKLVVNPKDELAFKRLALMMPGIGAKAADKLWRTFSVPAATPGIPAVSADAGVGGASPGPSPGTDTSAKTALAVRLQGCSPQVPKKAQAAWAQFVATVSQIDAPGLRRDPSGILSLVIDAGYEDYLKASYENYRTRLEDVQQLAVFARRFSSVDDFLAELALLTSAEADTSGPGDKADEEKLRLSTIHQAKGLEFDVVFVIMLCEGMFPSSRSMESEDAMEEERRLMYVAITRARNELYLSYPAWHASYGASGSGVRYPSRFLKEIPNELVEGYELPSFAGF